jgi:hypothetical protein
MQGVSAMVASYGSEEEIVATTVSIVVKAKKKLLEHKTFYCEDYSDMDEFTDAVMNYALEHMTEKQLILIDEPLPVEELDDLCPDCGQPIVRVPW